MQELQCTLQLVQSHTRMISGRTSKNDWNSYLTHAVHIRPALRAYIRSLASRNVYTVYIIGAILECTLHIHSYTFSVLSMSNVRKYAALPDLVSAPALGIGQMKRSSAL